MRDIRDSVLAFIVDVQPGVVFLEEQAFSQSGAMAREVAGMTWAVRIGLDAHDIDVRVVTASAARKLLLGRCPRAKIKQHVQAALRSIGAPFADSDDLCDAFTTGNYGLTELGHAGVMLGGLAA